MPKNVALIVPCFNEERRLDRSEFLRLARSRPGLKLVFVDDGSSDGTCTVLSALRAAEPARVTVVRLERNRGKAEAVRRGLQAGVAGGAEIVGYLDADLSTPVDEVLRLVEAAAHPHTAVLLGCRVRLLGTAIERRASRHYLGRIFATFASMALRLPVYDTQCGAKLFRASETLVAALEQPFRSRWIFDVELIARLLAGPGGAPPLPLDAFKELPLSAWRDVSGSKLRLSGMARAGLELLWLLVSARLRRRPRPVASARRRGAAPEALGEPRAGAGNE